MLTSDENLVDINLEVQYRRANALDYAFNVYEPEDTLKEVSESAIREVDRPQQARRACSSPVARTS